MYNKRQYRLRNLGMTLLRYALYTCRFESSPASISVHYFPAILVRLKISEISLLTLVKPVQNGTCSSVKRKRVS